MKETFTAIGIVVLWAISMIMIAALGSMIGNIALLYLEERYNLLSKFRLAPAA